MVGTKIFYTKGVGRHKEYLTSFELALRNAGIEPLNIVTISSILPPNCKKISKEEGLTMLKPGQIAFTVMARQATNEPNRLIAASIGTATPADSNMYGYLSEHHSYGETANKAGDYAEDLAATMLASTLGIEFDVEQAWDERAQVYKASGRIIRTSNITQSAMADKDGLWTTVLAGAVFCEFATPEEFQGMASLNDIHNQIQENGDGANS
jgi:arginine decarboxylase